MTTDLSWPQLIFFTVRVNDKIKLLKYIAEIPVKDVFETNYEINNKHLLDYYNTLKIILEKYEKEHSPNKNS